MSATPTQNQALRLGRGRPDGAPPGRIGRVVAGSLATGFAAALLMPAMPFIAAEEAEIAGAVLLGFAIGWAMLAVLSIRRTEQPQRWAVVPAVFMGVSGLLLVVFGSGAQDLLNWVWPPALLVLTVWMIVQARRHLRSRSRRWLLYPVFAVLLLSSIGGGYETVSEELDAEAYPMPGQLIDVGGHKLHLHCTGSGSPTVVLEPGAGEMSSYFGWIAPAVAADTRVCVYDRAGRGWSEPASNTQDAEQVATDLHTLLQRGGVPGPYVLAGHSFGGLYMLSFADRYPADVAGLVLIDSTAPKPGTTPPAETGSYDAMGRVSALLSLSARVGLARLYVETSYGSLPPSYGDQATATSAKPSSVHSTIDEYAAGTASTAQAALITDFADKPLFVLTAEKGSDAEWFKEQEELAALSTNSEHLVVDGASHTTLVEDKEDAAVTTEAILDVVSAVRDGAPLAD